MQPLTNEAETSNICSINICTSLGKLFLLMVKKIFLLYDHLENTTDEKSEAGDGIRSGLEFSHICKRENVDFLRFLCLDVSSVVHHLGSAVSERNICLTYLWVLYSSTYYIFYILLQQIQMFSCCFMTILCKTNRNTQLSHCGFFGKGIYSKSVKQDTKGYSLHLSSRTALQLWCQGTVTFLLGIFSSP